MQKSSIINQSGVAARLIVHCPLLLIWPTVAGRTNELLYTYFDNYQVHLLRGGAAATLNGAVSGPVRQSTRDKASATVGVHSR